MSNHEDHSDHTRSKSPLFIGEGVTIEGVIRHAGPTDERAVILGTLEGGLEWNGILEVPQGGKITASHSIRCREMRIGGEIVGANDSVVIETGLLRLDASACVHVATVSVPPGGLEQARGSVMNAKLRMTSDHPFAGMQVDEVVQPAPAPAAAPRLALAATGGVALDDHLLSDTAADLSLATAATPEGGATSEHGEEVPQFLRKV